MRDGFRRFLKLLEERGEVVRIREALSPVHEIPSALRIIGTRSKKVALFEKVQGYETPVVGNLLGTTGRLAMAMGLGAHEDVTEEFYRRTEKLVAPTVVREAPVLDAPLGEIDIVKAMPVLTHHEKDVSPYLTSAVTFAKDPETGIRGMGIHRVQVKCPNKVGIFLASPPLAEFFKKAEAMGKNLEIAIVIGIDPLTWLASVAYAPAGIDKLEIAGALRGEPVELVRCRTVDIEVPVEAEFVIEAKVLAGVRDTEGPFGESNGVYCTYENPVAEVLAISRRADPIYHGLMPFTSEEGVLIGVSWEAQMRKMLQALFPWVVSAHLDEQDWSRFIVQIAKPSEDAPRDLIAHVFVNIPYVKSVVVVDVDINIYDPQDVAFALATRMQPNRDVVIKADLPTLALDPSADAGPEGYRGSKIGLDATMPLADNDKYKKVRTPEAVDRKVEKLLRSYL